MLRLGRQGAWAAACHGFTRAPPAARPPSWPPGCSACFPPPCCAPPPPAASSVSCAEPVAGLRHVSCTPARSRRGPVHGAAAPPATSQHPRIAVFDLPHPAPLASFLCLLLSMLLPAVPPLLTALPLFDSLTAHVCPSSLNRGMRSKQPTGIFFHTAWCAK